MKTRFANWAVSLCMSSETYLLPVRSRSSAGWNSIAVGLSSVAFSRPASVVIVAPQSARQPSHPASCPKDAWRDLSESGTVPVSSSILRRTMAFGLDSLSSSMRPDMAPTRIGFSAGTGTPTRGVEDFSPFTSRLISLPVHLAMR